ncbi:MAG: hypothetical protein MUC32_11675 [Burkholderiaceae bacterium]|nr:hypothetical protein [Burkholderiaceae bacterium]
MNASAVYGLIADRQAPAAAAEVLERLDRVAQLGRGAEHLGEGARDRPDDDAVRAPLAKSLHQQRLGRLDGARGRARVRRSERGAQTRGGEGGAREVQRLQLGDAEAAARGRARRAEAAPDLRESLLVDDAREPRVVAAVRLGLLDAGADQRQPLRAVAAQRHAQVRVALHREHLLGVGAADDA